MALADSLDDRRAQDARRGGPGGRPAGARRCSSSRPGGPRGVARRPARGGRQHGGEGRTRCPSRSSARRPSSTRRARPPPPGRRTAAAPCSSREPRASSGRSCSTSCSTRTDAACTASCAPPAAAALARVRGGPRAHGLDPSAAAAASCPCPATSSSRGSGSAGPLRGAGRRRRRHRALRRAVKWTYPYEQLRRPNVVGTREILRLGAAGAVPVHHASTVGVFSSARSAGDVVAEDDDLSRAAELAVGYAQTKWVAEAMVRSPASRGLRSRSTGSTSGGHSRSGAFNPRDHVVLASEAASSSGTRPTRAAGPARADRLCRPGGRRGGAAPGARRPHLPSRQPAARDVDRALRPRRRAGVPARRSCHSMGGAPCWPSARVRRGTAGLPAFPPGVAGPVGAAAFGGRAPAPLSRAQDLVSPARHRVPEDMHR